MKKPNSLNSLCIKGYKELISSKFTTYSPSTSLMYKGIETSWEKIRPLSWKPPNSEIRQAVRNHGLKWNKLRTEWYGYVNDLDSLKVEISPAAHNLEIIN